MHSVKSKRTPSRMRNVVAWNRVPGSERDGRGEGKPRSHGVVKKTKKLRAHLVLRNDPRFSNPRCTNRRSLDLRWSTSPSLLRIAELGDCAIRQRSKVAPAEAPHTHVDSRAAGLYKHAREHAWEHGRQRERTDSGRRGRHAGSR